jgi:hypothetical protein
MDSIPSLMALPPTISFFTALHANAFNSNSHTWDWTVNLYPVTFKYRAMMFGKAFDASIGMVVTYITCHAVRGMLSIWPRDRRSLPVKDRHRDGKKRDPSTRLSLWRRNRTANDRKWHECETLRLANKSVQKLEKEHHVSFLLHSHFSID